MLRCSRSRLIRAKHGKSCVLDLYWKIDSGRRHSSTRLGQTHGPPYVESKGKIGVIGKSLRGVLISLQQEDRFNQRRLQTNLTLGPATNADNDVRSKISNASMLFDVQ